MDERTIADVAHGVAACYGREIKVIPGTLPKGSPPRRLPDTAKIEALGWGTGVLLFGAALAETVEWYRSNGDEGGHGMRPLRLPVGAPLLDMGIQPLAERFGGGIASRWCCWNAGNAAWCS